MTKALDFDSDPHEWEYSLGISNGSDQQQLVASRYCPTCRYGENEWLSEYPLTSTGMVDIPKIFNTPNMHCYPKENR